ncbi:lytic murein transglycosylase B [Endozoicomonas numazuensis]|uniref:lytic murein transglycosylase B n=1 Tax=Endozoicomonas numazuensis TaxID=1137799 RepID=UPI001F022191|nr:lytic murein transglycosylase B [Endozoicomonas numazuensis]
MALRAKLLSALFSSCLLAGPVMAADIENTVSKKPDYALQPEVKAFIDDLVKNEKFTRKELQSVLEKANKSDRVLELISRPAEKRLEWKDYRKIFMTQERVDRGVTFWDAHKKTLTSVEKDYGVPAHVIVAIIGVETYYGRQTGGFKVLDALSTLSFDYPPRSKFFTKQLKEFLILAREQKLDVSELTGSYAGAMGIPQFMPSSYRAYAVDYTGDGQSNIWKQEEDAIASVANYLRENGWKAGKPIVSKAKVTGTKYEKAVSDSVRPKKTLKQLEGSGWRPVAVLPEASKAAAIKLEGDKGPEYWLGMHNFYVITTYNRSKLYAMAVYQLARDVKSSYKTSVPKSGKTVAEKKSL